MHGLLVILPVLVCAALWSGPVRAACDEPREGVGWPCKNTIEVAKPAPSPPLSGPDLRYPCSVSGHKCLVSGYMRSRAVCTIYVVKDGRPVYRRDNATGECLEKIRDRRFGLASVTKSVTAYLLGHVRAAQSVDLDSRVSEVFAEMGRAYPGPGTIRDLLQMSSRMAWPHENSEAGQNGVIRIDRDERGNYAGGRSTLVEGVDAYLAKSPDFAPYPCPKGEVCYRYSSFDSVVLGQIVEHYLKQVPTASLRTLADGTQHFIYDRLAMTADADWKSDIEGHPPGHCCLYSNPHDMAVLGQEILERYKRAVAGRGNPVDDWVREMLETTVPMGESCYFSESFNLNYAYHWRVATGAEKSMFAYGSGGQFLQIYPDLNAVVVQFGDWGEPPPTWAFCEALSVHAAMARRTYP